METMTALGKRYITVVGDQVASMMRNRSHDDRPQHQPLDSMYFELIVDLDALPRTDFTDEQLAMHAERQALFWAAEFDRLAPCLGGHPARESETVRMRAVIEAMRPIVDAVFNYVDKPRQADHRPDIRAREARRLADAIDANRERLALAMSAWENSQTVSDAEKRDAVIEAATRWRYESCSALSFCERGEHELGCAIAEREAELCAAIDKLREQAAEVRR